MLLQLKIVFRYAPLLACLCATTVFTYISPRNVQKECYSASSTVTLTLDHCLALHDVATFGVFAQSP